MLRSLKVEIIKSHVTRLKISSGRHDRDLEVFVSQLVEFNSALLPEVEMPLLELPHLYPGQVSLAFNEDLELLYSTVVRHVEPEVKADATVLHDLQDGHETIQYLNCCES